MNNKKYIFTIVLLMMTGSLLATHPEDISKELKFEVVPWGYEEGVRNALTIYHILEDDNGIFWLGSYKGLYRFNGNSAINFTSRINEKQGNLISSAWTTALAIDTDKRIWFGTTRGVYVLDPKTENCISIPLEKTENITNFNAYINKVTIEGSFAYVGTRDGLYEVDSETLQVTNSFMTKAKPHNNRGTKSTVYNILPDGSNDDLWFSTRAGLHRKSSENRIDTFSIKSNEKIFDHYFLSGLTLNRNFYLPDYKYGVVKFDQDKKSFETFRIDDSEWNRGKSIVHLEQELFLVNAEGKGIAVFDAQSGKYHWLEANKITKVSNFNLFKDSAGYLWYASNGQLFKSNLSFPNTSSEHKTSLDIGNTFANGKRLNNLLGSPENLKLDHTENNLQVNFSLTNRWLFDDVTFQYRLNKNNWIDIADKNKLNLFNLSAGRHELTISAKDKNGEIATSTLEVFVYRPFTSSPFFFTLLFLVLVGIGMGIYYFNKKQYEKAAKVKSKYEMRLAQLESQALRSQINPHFIFNTLNSIKYYSIEKTPEETSDFISSFSTLIRRILENSKKNLITLEEEIETLRNYTDIEALRFHEHFEVKYQVDSAIETERFLVPPMIIQPFIENAIWHGLMHKKGNRKLSIHFKSSGIGVVCEIVDNGIGREASYKLKTNKNHKSSLGMKITKERMDIINTRNLTDNSFKIEDLVDKNDVAIGTKVSIFFLPKSDN